MPIYRKVYAAFWEGELAASLREEGDTDGFAVALYLMTGRPTNRIGCYALSMATLCDALGVDSRRASGALRKLSERGFAVLDERDRMAFVTEFARHEYGEVPNLRDNRVKALILALPDLMSVCRKSFVWSHFWDRYAEPWVDVLGGCHQPESEGLREGSGRAPEGVSDSGTGTGTGTGSGKKSPPTPRKRGRRIPAVTIPPELVKIGITMESFEERVRNTGKTKPAGAWEKELLRLRDVLKEPGVTADIVYEVWEDASSGGWQGCTPTMVRERAAKARGGNGRQQPQRRTSAPQAPPQGPLPEIDVPTRLAALAAALPVSVRNRADIERQFLELGSNGLGTEDVEERLKAIDRQVFEAAQSGLGQEALAQIDAKIGKGAALERLPAEEREGVEAQLREQLIREHLGLPVLSLFSPEAST